MRSARFTALATTSRTTSPGPATGSGTSVQRIESGPPGSLTVIAYMAGTLFPRAAPGDRGPWQAMEPRPCWHWPLRDLVLRTPRLELRPDDDAGLDGLVAAAYAGVHPPEEMPFLVPWTEADPAYLGRGMLQYFWSERARLAPEGWSVHFLVRREGRVIGTQGLTGSDFAITREVSSGSWLGPRPPGCRAGHGDARRGAAVRLRPPARPPRPLRRLPRQPRLAPRVGEARLPPDGSTRAPRGEPVDDVRLVVEEADFVRPDWTPAVEG